MCLRIQRERGRCEGQCLACVTALFKRALNITSYLARDLPDPVTALIAFAECVFMYEVITW